MEAARPSATGNVSQHSMRAIVNAIQYQNGAGCSWSLLPNDLPPPWTVKYFFYQWRDDGPDQTICESLRCRVRERTGRAEDPSLVVLGAQSVHAANNVPAATTGKDAGKRAPGRKRGIAVDIIGLIVAVVVLAAPVHDNQVGVALLNKAAASTAGVKTALVDQGSRALLSSTARSWASTCRSSSAMRRTPASFRSPSAGGSSRLTAR